jgi:ABC-type multidrug transport system fused ATPase/permease subunit
LDSELEEKILSVIHSELRGATVLVVSHRITSVRSADRILVMSDGRIIEQGSHDELVHRDGLYKLYTDRQRVAA